MKQKDIYDEIAEAVGRKSGSIQKRQENHIPGIQQAS